MKSKILFFVIFTCVFCVVDAHVLACDGFECGKPPLILDQMIDETDILKPMRSTIQWADGTTITNVINTATVDDIDVLDDNGICESTPLQNTLVSDCPFESDIECDIWRKKPIHSTVVAPRGPRINPVRIDEIIAAIYLNRDITANDTEMEPLVERYKILMRASHACCMGGIVYKMRQNNATDLDIYQFLKTDAKDHVLTLRCMVMSDQEFIPTYTNGVTNDMVMDVRNTCLCKNRKWFETLLQPYFDIYEDAPDFAKTPFTYRYSDDLSRGIRVNINEEVQTVGNLLNKCPK